MLFEVIEEWMSRKSQNIRYAHFKFNLGTLILCGVILH